MSSKKILALDADGVLLNYLVGLIEYCRKTGHPVHCEAHEVDNWSMRKAFGIPQEDDTHDDYIFARIKEFSTSEEFGSIPFIEGAVEAVRYLKSLDENISVVAITSAGRDEETIRRREYNLRDIPFDEIHVLPLGSSKKEHLSKLPAGSVFVDDLYDHVRSAEEVGLHGVLFRQPYNAKDNPRYSISDWAEGKELIASLLTRTPELEIGM